MVATLEFVCSTLIHWGWIVCIDNICWIMAATNLVRLCCLGDGGVGKTSITIQLCSNHFVEMYDPTIEDSYRKQMVIDDEAVLLEILDTAGQEELTALRDQWIRGAEGYILVYSVTSRSSLEQVSSFQHQITRVQDRDDLPMIVVGNKCDLNEIREISTEEGRQFAKCIGSDFLECSAKTRYNIEQIFINIVRLVRASRSGKKANLKETKKRKITGGKKKKPKCTII